MQLISPLNEQNIQLLEAKLNQFFDNFLIQNIQASIIYSNTISPCNQLQQSLSFENQNIQLMYYCILNILQAEPQYFHIQQQVDNNKLFVYYQVIVDILIVKQHQIDKNQIIQILQQFIYEINFKFDSAKQNNQLLSFLNKLVYLALELNAWSQQDIFDIQQFVKQMILICQDEDAELGQLHRVFKRGVLDLFPQNQLQMQNNTIYLNNTQYATQFHFDIISFQHIILEYQSLANYEENINIFFEIILITNQIFLFQNSELLDTLIIKQLSGLSLFLEMIMKKQNQNVFMEQNKQSLNIICKQVTDLQKLVFSQFEATFRKDVKLYIYQFSQFFEKFILFVDKTNQFTISDEYKKLSSLYQIQSDDTINQSEKQQQNYQYSKPIMQNKNLMQKKFNMSKFKQDNQTNLLKQLSQNLITQQIGQTKNELLEQTKLIFNINELFFEHGQQIQQYSKTELPASVIRLLISLFDQNNPKNYIETLNLLQHFSVPAIFQVLKKFIKHNIKVFLLASQQFYLVLENILLFFNQHYFKQQQQKQKNDLEMFQILENIIHIIYQVVINSTDQQKQLLVSQNLITQVIEILIQQQLLIESLTESCAQLILYCIQHQSKYYNKIYQQLNQKQPQILIDLSDIFSMLLNYYLQINVKVEEENNIYHQQTITIYLLDIFTELITQQNEQNIKFVINNFEKIKYVLVNCIQQQINTQQNNNQSIIKNNYNNKNLLYSTLSLVGVITNSLYSYKNDQEIKYILQQINQIFFNEIFVEQLVKHIAQIPFPVYDHKCYFLLYLSYLFTHFYKLQKRISTGNLKTYDQPAYNNLINNIMYLIYTFFSYFLNQQTILFVIPMTFDIIQQNEFGCQFASQILVKGYIGCSSNIDAYTNDNIPNNAQTNINKITLLDLFDLCYQNKIENNRLWQEYSKLSYLYLLGHIQINEQTSKNLFNSNIQSVYDVVNQGFLNQPNQQQHEQCMSDIIQQSLQNTPYSLTSMNFILTILTISLKHANYKEIKLIAKQLIPIEDILFDFWSAKNEIVSKFSKNQNNVHEYTNSPNSQSRISTIQITNVQYVDSWYLLQQFSNLLHFQELKQFLLKSGIMIQTMQILNIHDIESYIYTYGTMQMGLIFNNYLNYISCIQCDTQIVNKYHQSFMNAYDHLYQIIQKQILQKQETQNVSELKQTLLSLQYSLLINSNTHKNLFALVVKHTKKVMKIKNINYEQLADVRIRNNKQIITNLQNSEFQTIIDINEEQFNSILQKLYLEFQSNVTLTWQVDLQKVIEFAKCYSFIFLFHYLHYIISIIQKDSIQQMIYIKNLLHEFLNLITQYDYQSHNNDTTIISEQLTKDLCNLHTKIQSQDIIGICFQIIVKINSFKIDSKSSLLLVGQSQFLPNYIVYFKQQINQNPDKLKFILNNLNYFISKLEEKIECLDVNLEQSQQQQQQSKQINNYLLKNVSISKQNSKIFQHQQLYSVNLLYDTSLLCILDSLKDLYNKKQHYLHELTQLFASFMNIQHLFNTVCFSNNYLLTFDILQIVKEQKLNAITLPLISVFIKRLNQDIILENTIITQELQQYVSQILILLILNKYTVTLDKGDILFQIMQIQQNTINKQQFLNILQTAQPQKTGYSDLYIYEKFLSDQVILLQIHNFELFEKMRNSQSDNNQFVIHSHNLVLNQAIQISIK